jgi:methionyl-tRNA synthetase
MVGRYFDGVLPASEADAPAEKALAESLSATVERAEAAIDRLAIHEAITAVADFVGSVNVYISEQEPWKVARDESPEARARLATILYCAAESLRAIAVLHSPVMPKTSAALWASLGADALGPLAEQRIQDAGRWGRLPAGVTLTKGESLFPRLADDE